MLKMLRTVKNLRRALSPRVLEQRVPVQSAPVRTSLSPQQQAAIDLRDDYINHTVGYDVQGVYDKWLNDLRNLEMPKAKGFLLEDPLADTALWAGAALLAGGAAGNATADKGPKTREELEEYAKEHPELMIRWA